MAVELTVPKVGESISEVEIGEWLKSEGDAVARDETVVMLDSAKTTVELPAPVAGVLGKILKRPGETAAVGEVIAVIEESGAGAAAQTATKDAGNAAGSEAPGAAAAPAAAPAATPPQPELEKPAHQEDQQQNAGARELPVEAREQSRVMPAARRVLAEQGMLSDEVPGSGPGGRVLKEDALRHAEARHAEARRAGSGGQNGQQTAAEPVQEGAPEPSPIDRPAPPQPDGQAAQETRQPAPAAASPQQSVDGQSATAANAQVAAPPAPSTQTQAPAAGQAVASGEEEVVPMSLLRRHVAQRLVEAQQSAALLTTFNEIDMTNVMALRKEHQEAFQKKYNIKLGFMSFFVKAAIDALKQTPGVNAEIRGKDIVYKNYYDIGVAIGGGKGLVVPVLRRAERMSFAEVETAIAGFAARVRDNKLSPDDLLGGTFTITNGGIYGSLMSTPIINPPQSGILGMHAIQERPVARDGQVVIRPMMYVALTYDHRLVDGREAVTFLVRIKECIENPARMLIEV